MAFKSTDWRDAAFGILPQPGQYGQAGMVDTINGFGGPPLPKPASVAPVQAPLPKPVTTAGVSTMSSPLSGIIGFGGDPLAQALAGTKAFDSVTGIDQDYTTPAAQAGGWKGMLKDTFLNEGGGLNLDAITSTLGAGMSIYGAIKSLGLAQDSLDFSKKAFNTNLENQRKTYNTALEDRIRTREQGAGRDGTAVDDYMKKNRL